MRPADGAERERLAGLFAELCAIPSPFGSERACAEYVARELRRMGLGVEEDGVAAEVGADCGNLLARIPGRGDRTILLCAHLDTVAESGTIEPVLVDGAWKSAGDTILGADNKAAVAVLLEVARRCAVEGAPVGLELLFTVSEEVGLLGAKAFDVSTLRSDWGYVFDHASPIGEIIVASPTYYRIEADFRGTQAGVLAASWMWWMSSATIASALTGSSERASPRIVQRPGTTFVPPWPPEIVPMFAVVSASIRPSRIAAIARAAASIALRPSSGRIPACACVPRKSASIR